jgi:hypothetical protein
MGTRTGDGTAVFADELSAVELEAWESGIGVANLIAKGGESRSACACPRGVRDADDYWGSSLFG